MSEYKILTYYYFNLLFEIKKSFETQGCKNAVAKSIQSFLNFFIPSGSGQAALTMPVLAPLGDLIGISRQTVVLAFQFGDGFSNMIIPTSAVTMGVLSLAEVPWEKWARWILPLFLIFILLSMIFLVPPFFMSWQ